MTAEAGLFAACRTGHGWIDTGSLIRRRRPSRRGTERPRHRTAATRARVTLADVTLGNKLVIESLAASFSTDTP